MTALEIHTKALLERAKGECLKKFENKVYKRKNGHPMYYEEYNSTHKNNPKGLLDLMH